MWLFLLTRVLQTSFGLGERQSGLDEKRKRRSFKILIARKPPAENLGGKDRFVCMCSVFLYEYSSFRVD